MLRVYTQDVACLLRPVNLRFSFSRKGGGEEIIIIGTLLGVSGSDEDLIVFIEAS